MSQDTGQRGVAEVLQLRPEKDAMSAPIAGMTPMAQTSAPKLRSCVTCRARKVRCDKQSPCSNCRRANIACVSPAAERAPRWARRLERHSNTVTSSNDLPLQTANSGVDKVMERLRNLESLVKELRGQLEQAQSASASNSPGSSTEARDAEQHKDRSSATETRTLHAQFGRLVIQDASRSRYISSGFWSRVEDELDGLKMDLVGHRSDDSEDESFTSQMTPFQEVARAPSERHAFLFRHHLQAPAPDIHELHPLPMQVPFLLEIFSENVNYIIRAVHMPSVTKMMRESRASGITTLTPSNEALMFSIYYAAIISMEEDDVATNFGASKAELSHKFRVGLECTLAKADFLNAPDIVLVQAMATFLCLARRHDSPKWVYMMIGLLIRMAQFLGLQRDGSQFADLTPFEIEMRRRVWWTICMLDLRGSEDQGMDLTIARGSFDTKIPLNFNEMDIEPETKQMPAERYGVTDMSWARIAAGMTDIMRQMMANNTENSVAGLEDQSRLLNQIYQQFEREYLQHTTGTGNVAYWVAVNVARLIMAKMTLISHLPVLFSSPDQQISNDIRTKLLVAAIEVAEYNHALNAEEACRHWRWVYQTTTHWHSIVYLLIEISRRQWSPTIERAWMALQSPWLIPTRIATDKNLGRWVPLKRLMDKARRHRNAELNRLRVDPEAAGELEAEEEKLPIPSSSGPFPTGSAVKMFRQQWRQLISVPAERADLPSNSGIINPAPAWSSAHTPSTNQPLPVIGPGHIPSNLTSHTPSGPIELGSSGQNAGMSVQDPNLRRREAVSSTSTPQGVPFEQVAGQQYIPFSTRTDYLEPHVTGSGFNAWLWADADPSVNVFSNMELPSTDADMDLDTEVNWYDWVEIAKGMDWEARPGAMGPT